MSTLQTPPGGRSNNKSTTAETRAGELGDKARRVAGDVAEEAQDEARGMGERLKTTGAQRVEGVADDLERRAEEQDSPIARPLLKAAAGGAREIASAIDGASFNELTSALSRSARRNPVLFAAGAFVAGFAASRFLKASPVHEHDWRRDRDFRDDRDRRYGATSAGGTRSQTPGYGGGAGYPYGPGSTPSAGGSFPGQDRPGQGGGLGGASGYPGTSSTPGSSTTPGASGMGGSSGMPGVTTAPGSGASSSASPANKPAPSTGTPPLSPDDVGGRR